MGIGIIGVMIGHWMQWSNVGRIIYYSLIPFVGLVFTEGFLLLSGFGVYCSLNKDSNLKLFLAKRAKRLLFPYWIMVVPMSLLTLINGESISNIILEIITLKYWIYGNTAMWYVSVSLLLYLLSPFLFCYCFANKQKLSYQFAIILVLLYSVGIIISFFFPGYYKNTYLGFTQMPMFFIGMGIGHLFINNNHLKNEILILLLIFCAGISLSLTEGIFEQYANGFNRFFGILCSCIVLEWFSKKINYSFVFLEWFGRLSLELYIMHIMLFRLLSPHIEGTISATISILIAILVAPCVNRLIKLFV